MESDARKYLMEKTKEQVINTSLIVASIIGSLVFVFSFVTRIINAIIDLSVVYQSIVLLTLLIATLRRNRIKNSTKAYLLISLILFLSLTDAYFFGLLSTTRAYLVLIPLYSIIFLTYYQSLAIYFTGIVGFIAIGYLHNQGIIEIPKGYEASNYIEKFYPWIINSIHIVSVGLIILFVTRRIFFSLSGLIKDLEEQNRVISNNEKNYREIFNSTSEAIFIHNASDGQIYDVNEVMLRMYGFDSKEEVLKLSVKDISSQGDVETQERAQKLIRKAIEEGPYIFEWQSKRKNGEQFYSEISLKSTPIGGEGRVLAVVRDITERKLMEQKIRESEELYRTLLESINEVIIVADNNHVVQFVNKRFTEILGYTPDEIVGKIGYKILHDPEDLHKVENANRDRIDKSTTQYELAFKAKDGTKYDFLVNGSPILDPNGKTIASIGAMVDITDKKKAERELEEYRNHLEYLVKERTEELEASNEELQSTNEELCNQREELENIRLALEKQNDKLQSLHKDLLFEKSLIDALMNTMPDAIYFKDRESRFIRISSSKALKSGFESSYQLIGKTDFDLFAEEHAREAFDDEQEIIRSGKPIVAKVEKETYTDDRPPSYVSSTKMPLRDVDGNIIGTFGVSRDITRMVEMELAITKQNQELTAQRKELEQTLEKLKNTQQQLINAEKMASLGVMATGIAHEINNPLNFIHGGVVALERYFRDKLSTHMQEVSSLFEIINTGVLRAAKIVKSLDHYNQKSDTMKKSENLHTIINNCLLILNNLLKNRVRVEKDFCDSPYFIVCNEGKLHQAILSIITNAIQAIEDCGTIKIQTSLESKNVVVSIADTGCGIPKESISKLTDPFFTTKDTGSGLGLSITQNIINEHNGTLEIQSEFGKGTQVIVKLPLY
ncbi:MAG: PAS domain S-box protein [Tenuifilaceae bacterium]|jgi:PAS domain S-box-containing protein|nr:PAS domain S-box protein [Tenuifilaceae bacterium]